jgi:ADP-heptose:LPS heptosyltransferase
LKDKFKNILYIHTGGGIGDALTSLPLLNYINENFYPKKIFYYSTDLQKFWYENNLSEFKPTNLISIKNFPEHFGFRDNHKFISKSLINKFDFDHFDLIIDNQTRFKNTLIYKKIPHKYFVSPCVNFLLSKPFFFIKKNKNVTLRIIEYLNRILKDDIKPNYKIEIPNNFINLARKLMPNDKKYIGFSITAGHPTRIKEVNISEIIKLANYYSKTHIPTFFIENKYIKLKEILKKEVKDIFFPEEYIAKNFQKPMIVTALGSLTEFNITIDNGISHMLSFSNNKTYIFYNQSSKKFMPYNKNCSIFDCKLNDKKINTLKFEEILNFIENN